MNSITTTIIRVIFTVVFVVSLVFGLVVLFGGGDLWLDLLLKWSETIAVIMLPLGLVLVAPIWGIINLIIKLIYNFDKRKKELIIWIVVLSIPIFLAIGYNVASDTLPTFFGVEDYNLTVGTSKLVDAALYVTYLFAIVAFVSLLFTFVKDFLTGRRVK